MLKSLKCYNLYSVGTSQKYEGRIYASRVEEFPDIRNTQFFIGEVLVASKWDIVYEQLFDVLVTPSSFNLENLPDYNFQEVHPT